MTVIPSDRSRGYGALCKKPVLGRAASSGSNCPKPGRQSAQWVSATATKLLASRVHPDCYDTGALGAWFAQGTNSEACCELFEPEFCAVLGGGLIPMGIYGLITRVAPTRPGS
jgi:hypothetical protein